MQFSCYFPRKKHFVKKIPIKGKKKDKGQFMSGVIKGSYLSPSASQSVLECFLHINYRKQGEDVAFLHGFSSWKVSQLPAVPPGAGWGAPGWEQTAWVGLWAAAAQQGQNTEIIIPLSSCANEQLTLPRTAFPVSPEV